jgi:hypothetical protein
MGKAFFGRIRLFLKKAKKILPPSIFEPTMMAQGWLRRGAFLRQGRPLPGQSARSEPARIELRLPIAIAKIWSGSRLKRIVLLF